MKSIHLVFFNNNLLVHNGLTSLVDSQMLPEVDPAFECSYFNSIGTWNGHSVHCSESNTSEAPKDCHFESLRSIAFKSHNPEWFNLLSRASQIVNWDKTYQHCSKCMSKLIRSDIERVKTCIHCNILFYPRISPSVIVLIKRENQILLARSPHFPKGRYGLIAGFIESGESVEEAIAREVKEEVGLSVKNIQYKASQSWPFPDSLMLGFTADYDSGTLTLDGNELEDAHWFDVDNLPELPMHLSIARQLIEKFKY